MSNGIRFDELMRIDPKGASAWAKACDGFGGDPAEYVYVPPGPGDHQRIRWRIWNPPPTQVMADEVITTDGDIQLAQDL